MLGKALRVSATVGHPVDSGDYLVSQFWIPCDPR